LLIDISGVLTCPENLLAPALTTANLEDIDPDTAAMTLLLRKIRVNRIGQSVAAGRAYAAVHAAPSNEWGMQLAATAAAARIILRDRAGANN
jgi:hypothetical protein